MNPFNVFSGNPFKNPFLSRVIASMLRLAVGVVAGYLIKQGWMSSAEASEYTTEIIATLLTAGAAAWAIYDKHQSEVRTNTALALPAMSPALLDAKIASGQSAPAAVDVHSVPVIEKKVA